MPLFRDFSTEDDKILIWKYQETDHFDVDDLLEENNKERIKKFHPKKIAENLMIRKMLQGVFPQSKIDYKDHGEPFLFPAISEISISHSFPFAVVALSKNKIGIDLERITPKIKSIKHKFLFPSEYEWASGDLEIDLLTIIWTIKESLYKIHPSKYWSLKTHYEVFPFHLHDLSKIRCRVFDEHSSVEFFARVVRLENYYLTIVK